MNKTTTHPLYIVRLGCLAAALALAGCASSELAPATADVAVSRNAIDSAVSAGAVQHAPAELSAAREKMMRANQALADRDYKIARELAVQAQADARLAQSKATAAKATAASQQMNEGLRVLREEVDRTKTQ